MFLVGAGRIVSGSIMMVVCGVVSFVIHGNCANSCSLHHATRSNWKFDVCRGDFESM